MTILRNCTYIDKVLEEHRDLLGSDFEGYKSHVYRTYNIIRALQDDISVNDIEIELALAYHDLGLWDEHTLNYLDHSVDFVNEDCEKYNLEVDKELISDLIHYHHKPSPYMGPNEELINLFRKADWIDMNNTQHDTGITKGFLKELQLAYPDLGFHERVRELGHCCPYKEMKKLRYEFTTFSEAS